MVSCVAYLSRRNDVVLMSLSLLVLRLSGLQCVVGTEAFVVFHDLRA